MKTKNDPLFVIESPERQTRRHDEPKRVKSKRIKAWKVKCYGYESSSTIYKKKSDAVAAFEKAKRHEHPAELIPLLEKGKRR